MATTTTNFGWTVPSDTDLVKDGAAAIRTALGGVDTSFVDLKGGTTGQVLSKATGTDLDFSWVALDDSNAIQNAIVDAKGDLIGATAADTPARLAVGTNGQILTADSTAATGLKWATPAAGGKVLQVVFATTSTQTSTTGNTFIDTGLTGSITPSSTSSKVLVIWNLSMQKDSGSINNGILWQLLRGATNLQSCNNPGEFMTGTSVQFVGSTGRTYLDEPASTSSLTYKLQFRNYVSDGTTVRVQPSSVYPSTITLIEIGA
jgi:hypothetical protein